MSWWPLRKSTGESLAVSMAGVKLGDRLLVIGCSDPMLVALLGAKTGLTGRTAAVDERDTVVVAAADVAAREGVLLETFTAPLHALPLENDGFDVVIVRDVFPHVDATTRAACLTEVGRVLRAGGRCLVIDGTTKKGFLPRVRNDAVAGDYTVDGGPAGVLTAQGFKAARVLAEREGLLFAEAVKPAQ